MAAQAFDAYNIFGLREMTEGEVWLCGITILAMEMTTTSLNVWRGGIG